MSDPSSNETTDDTRKAGALDRLMTWMHLKDEHPILPLSLIRYVPVSVLLNFLAVILLVFLGYDTLLAAFLTNVPLNGLIITIMSIGVGMSVVANIRL